MSVPTVLVVEDDADLREIERTVLEYYGFSVASAVNGAEALRLLEHATPDVILLDLMMPVMDGLAFLPERARRGIAERVPVVCVSAAGERMMTQALRLGATECIQKPTDFDQLCSRVSEYCRPRT